MVEEKEESVELKLLDKFELADKDEMLCSSSDDSVSRVQSLSSVFHDTAFSSVVNAS